MKEKIKRPSRKKIVIANWKMNPVSLSEAKKIFLGIKKELKGVRGVEVVIAPPAPFIALLAGLKPQSSLLRFGAQDVFWENKGSFTGEIGAKQLKEVGVSYAIVGHSERRKLGESNEEISKKLLAASKEGLRAVLCVGEDKRDSHGDYLSSLQKEIKESLAGIYGARLDNLIIAYEPRWAIGKTASESIDAEELHAMSIFIRKTLASVYGKKAALSIPIIYGGSVEPANAASLAQGAVDGFLVGHASLIPSNFAKIVRALKL